ncbi:uncharacterized protein LOC126679910 [Mercurialis annua]|uniref:uncharacterized protein LOC126679910 n=1 Tax=Mercurialis annua TaxID=3986 RepID=UPI00215FCCBA|nr:uncharacterized protein LOC126679910 [Mercurialis annua]
MSFFFSLALMEIEGDDGSKIDVEEEGNSKAVFGRGLRFNTKDRTVSRRHVLFKIENQTEPRVSFQVIGKNPIWVRSSSVSDDKNREIRVYRKLEKGELAVGDWFCISSQNPVWFNLKRIGSVNKEAMDLESGDLERVELSTIDPVKEFGFLIIGHEFDCYPKQRIKDARNWDWFLEESKLDSDNDDDGSSANGRNKRVKKKRKKGVGNDDDDEDDWSGESEEDKEIVAKVRKMGRSKYSTRSKDERKTKTKKASLQKKSVSVVDDEGEEDEDEEDEDETLQGFIVSDDDEVEEIDEEEEEEFVDDDDDDDELDD